MESIGGVLKMQSEPGPAWERVKEMERVYNMWKNQAADYEQSRNLMLVNFGPEGRVVEGLVSGEQSLVQMLAAVFTFLLEEKDEQNNA